jgi:hypothetical protein
MAGLNENEFVDMFTRVLSNDKVIKKLQDAVCGELRKEVAQLRDIVKSKDGEISDLRKRVSDLEVKQDESEQYSRRNSLRISGVQESNSEDIVEKTLDLFNSTMDLDVSPEQIDRLHRVGKRSDEKARSILVKFATYRTRNKVMRNRTLLKNVPQPQATDQGQTRIFINEDLTKYRSNLLYQARQLKKRDKIKDCWSWDGTILVKNNAGKIIAVRTTADLQKEAA